MAKIPLDVDAYIITLLPYTPGVNPDALSCPHYAATLRRLQYFSIMTRITEYPLLIPVCRTLPYPEYRPPPDHRILLQSRM